jgi:hypothetical protein
MMLKVTVLCTQKGSRLLPLVGDLESASLSESILLKLRYFWSLNFYFTNLNLNYIKLIKETQS